MKKITTKTVIALLTMLIISCSKTSTSDVRGLAQPRQSVVTQPEVNIVGNWITLNSFTIETDRRGNRFVKGAYGFSGSTQPIYDENSYVELVYARIPTHQRIPYQYKKLSFTVNVETSGVSANVVIDNSLDPDGLKILYKDAAFQFLARAVDISQLDDWKFRYLVIPSSKYNSLNIDWNDLSAVAAALNFSL